MSKRKTPPPVPTKRPSALLDTRVIYRDDILDPLRTLSNGCVDPINLWHRFPIGNSNSNRNDEVFWGDMTEPRPSGSGACARFEDRHASTQAYIDSMRLRCQQLARVLKPFTL